MNNKPTAPIKRVSPQLQGFAMAQEQRHNKQMQIKARNQALANFDAFIAFVALAFMLFVVAQAQIAKFLVV